MFLTQTVVLYIIKHIPYGEEKMKFSELKIKQIKTVVHYKPDISSWEASERRDHIIGITISGTTYHDLGYKSLNLAPNCIYFLNQKDNFTAKVEEAGYCYSVHFTTYEPIDTESFCKKVNNIAELHNLIEKIERSWLLKDHDELKMLSDFYNLCNQINKLYNIPYVHTNQNVIVAKEYIDLNFRDKNCLEKAVNIFGLSRRRFNDVFKLHFNITPNNYIISRKIDYSKELLSLGYLSISEISEICAFSDVYYFSKVFKSITGTTPGEYKKKHSAYNTKTAAITK